MDDKITIDLNNSPVKKIRVVRHDSFNDKIVAKVGQKKLSSEEIEVISEWLSSLGIEHYCWKDKISFSNEIEIIDVLTKADLKRMEIREEIRKKELELKKSLSDFPKSIQNFVNNNFKDHTDFAKNRISKMLNNDIKPSEVGLRWGASTFEDVIDKLKIDSSSINTINDIWECIRNVYLDSKLNNHMQEDNNNIKEPDATTETDDEIWEQMIKNAEKAEQRQSLKMK